MAKKVLDTETLKIYSSLKQMCKTKKMNYTFMSKKLSEKIENNTRFIYVTDIEIDKSIVFLDKNKNPFELLNYFKLVDGDVLAIVKTSERVFLLDSDKILNYPFDINRSQLDIVKEYKNNNNLKSLCQKFNESISVIDRIILKYANIDLSLIKDE